MSIAICLTHSQFRPRPSRLILSLPPSKIRQRHRRKTQLNRPNLRLIRQFEIHNLRQRRTLPLMNQRPSTTPRAFIGSERVLNLEADAFPDREAFCMR
jgi:hypothetical protein